MIFFNAHTSACACVHPCVFVCNCFLCLHSTLDATDGKLFILLCPKFPLRPQSFLLENDGEYVQFCVHVHVRVHVTITCDITTLISSLVIVKSLWMGRLSNGKEGKMRVCLCVAVRRRQPMVSARSSLLSPKLLHCKFVCKCIWLDNQMPSEGRKDSLNRWGKLREIQVSHHT